MTQWGLDTLFNPAKRHMDEEKRRLQSTREEVGDNSGGKRIDFETGKVVIRRSGDDGEDTDSADTQAINAADDTVDDADRLRTTRAGKPASTKKATAAGPTAAQLRAAKRRGRTAR